MSSISSAMEYSPTPSSTYGGDSYDDWTSARSEWLASATQAWNSVSSAWAAGSIPPVPMPTAYTSNATLSAQCSQSYAHWAAMAKCDLITYLESDSTSGSWMGYSWGGMRGDNCTAWTSWRDGWRSAVNDSQLLQDLKSNQTLMNICTDTNSTNGGGVTYIAQAATEGSDSSSSTDSEGVASAARAGSLGLVVLFGAVMVLL